jgi:ribonuclease D
VRRLCWTPPAEPTPESVSAFLADLGARPWQIQLTTPLLTKALTARPATGA